MKSLLGVYGAGGHGREVMPLVAQAHGDAEVVFVDDGPGPAIVNGRKVLTWDEFLGAGGTGVSIAIADGKLRKRLAARCASAGIPQIQVQASNVVLMDDVRLAAGAILSPFVTLTSNIEIGLSFHAHMYCYVAHDCVIGDFVTFGPSVKCNGNVRVEDGAYIGTGAMLRQGRPGKPLVIGRDAVVGMGAVVTKDVPPETTVVGNPARPLLKD